MTNQIADLSLRQTARIAGILYLTIIVAGIFAEFFVRSSLFVPGDAAATAENVVASEGLFRVGMTADLIMILSDVALAVAKGQGQHLALVPFLYARVTELRGIHSASEKHQRFCLVLGHGLPFVNAPAGSIAGMLGAGERRRPDVDRV